MAIRAICRPGHDCDRFAGTRTRPSARVAVPREEWIEVPVPALVDAAVFEAAQAQLAENRQRKRDGLRGPRWLLQGLTVCRRCGYAYYGKTTPRSGKDPSKGEYHQYRCIGTDGHRFGGVAVCTTGPCGATISSRPCGTACALSWRSLTGWLSSTAAACTRRTTAAPAQRSWLDPSASWRLFGAGSVG